MKKIVLIICFFLSFPVLGRHIVGGEIELVHLQGSTYRVNLIYYFDVANNPARLPEDEEPTIVLGLFRKHDHARLGLVTLNFQSKTRVSYTQPACSRGDMITDRLVYSTTIVLGREYNHAQGYYLSWERCCRNYNSAGLINIVSAEPPSGVANFPDAAGQTFYLEFPPVVKDGQPFINSSPQLFPPLNDYACSGKPYYADFTGTDKDGDSLVYSLVTPYSTHNAEAVPANGPRPGPYPLVAWRDPFSLTNIIGGRPDLKISAEGMLTVTPSPTLQGVFVFSVLCEEFRAGIKIGELRRDFQMLVVDCQLAVPPKITGQVANGPFVEGQLNVSFSNTVSDADRCVTVRVTDDDAFRQADFYRENIGIKAIAIGFKKDVSGILQSPTSATLTPAKPYHDFQICFDECPFKLGPFKIGIIAYDDACSLPLMDTLILNVTITPPTNARAQFLTANVVQDVNEGATVPRWTIEGVDADHEELVLLAASPDASRLATFGFDLQLESKGPGSLIYSLGWNTKCDEVDFSKQRNFFLKFLLNDIDHCNVLPPDTMTLDLSLLVDNLPPVIDSDLRPGNQERIVTGITRKVNESLAFKVWGNDYDLPADVIVLGVKGVDFNIDDYAISFSGATGNGYATSDFVWDITCDNVDLAVKNEFAFQFTVVDNLNKCHIYQADTLDVVVTVKPPDNIPPSLTIVNLNPEIAMMNNTMAITLGQQITLGVAGTDRDHIPQPDLLKLELIKAEGNVTPEGYTFENAERRGTVESVFTWKPECSIFKDGIYENNYTFTFRVGDDRCFTDGADTLAVNINIKDVVRNDSEFLPPNFISPNDDGLNDFFAMVKMDEMTGALVSILPEDNCTGWFERITIFNRWGKEVFESRNRDFRWHALHEATGQYYYVLKYSHKNYKGLITVSYGESQRNR